MPYSSVKEVPDYVPEAHRKQWLEVFNSAYAAAKKDGKSDKDAESSAFAQANGVVKKEKASETMAEQNYATVGGVKVDRSDFAYAPEGSKPSEWKLPIHDESYVRNALARYNQADIPSSAKAAVKAKILARAHKHGIDTSGFEKEHASDMPRFISLLAGDGTDGVIRIPIAITGKWMRGKQEFAISEQDLAEIRSNFGKRKNGEINVDYDHASEMPEVAAGGPIPSAGRIVGIDEPEEFMRGSGRNILWGRYEPTPRAHELIKNREYRYISPAIDWGARDKQVGERQGATLTSIALTNRPFLEEMPQIHLSDPAYRPVENSEEKEHLVDVDAVHVPAAMPDFSVQAKQPVEGAKPDSKAQGTGGKEAKKMLKPKKIEAGEHAGKMGCYDGENLVGMMEEADVLACYPGAKFSEESFAAFLTNVGIPKEAHTPDKLKAMLVAGEAAQKSVRAAESRRLLLTEVIVNGKVDSVVAANHLASGKISAEDFKAGIAAEKRVDGAIQAGKLLPRNRGEGIRLVLSETETFKPFESFIERGKPLVNLNPRGIPQGSLGDATQDLRMLAKARAEEKKITFGQALSEVAREHPELAREHRDKVTTGEQ